MTETSWAEMARTAVDDALRGLGRLPLVQNGDFREREDLPGVMLYELHRTDAAPLRFSFGHDFEVGVGPIPEVYVAVRADASRLSGDVRRILTSRIRVAQERRRVEVELIDRDGTVWLRSRRRVAWGAYDPVLENVDGDFPPAYSEGGD